MIWERLIKWKDETVELLNIELTEYKEPGMERFNNGKLDLASTLFKDMIISDNFDEFLTLPAYNYI